MMLRALRHLRSLRQGLAGLLLLASAAHAQEASSLCPPPAPHITAARLQDMATQRRDRGLLWRVQHEGKTSWLYGTVHVGRDSWLIPGEKIASALQHSDLLLLELDVTSAATQQALAQGLAARPDAPPLPAALAQRLQQQATRFCAEGPLQRLRPEGQLVSLMMMAGRHQGLHTEFGVDLALASMAKILNKPMAALETPEQQLKLLTSDDPAEVEQALETGLHQLETGVAQRSLLQTARVWERGDATELARYAQWCDCVNTEAERREFSELIDERNPGMAAGIATQLRAGRSVFAAMGALHLVGEQGVPALLARQGFQVQAVPLGRPDAQAGSDANADTAADADLDASKARSAAPNSRSKPPSEP